MICPFCKYEWTPRTPNPKRCPGPRCGKWLDLPEKEKRDE